MRSHRPGRGPDERRRENGDGRKTRTDEGGSILDDGGIDTDERAGTQPAGIEPDKEPDEETKQEMEEEREQRLDPDNRPDGAEVDNTERTFDVERGQFTDSEDYDESEPAPFSDPEDPNTDDDAGDADDDAMTTRTTVRRQGRRRLGRRAPDDDDRGPTTRTTTLTTSDSDDATRTTKRRGHGMS